MRYKSIPWKKANPFGTIRFYFHERKSKIHLLLPSLFVTLLVISILLSVFAFFATIQYNWDTSDIFIFLFVAGTPFLFYLVFIIMLFDSIVKIEIINLLI